MPDLPPITQPFLADTSRYVAACRITARHLTALADELEALDAPFGVPEHCCVCGSHKVVYHNYQEKPFCRGCADGEPPGGM